MTKPRLIHVPEPQLEFRFGQTVDYPRDGLYLFGPVDYELGRPQSTVAVADRVMGKITLEEKHVADLAMQPTLFGQDEAEAEVYK